jgi:RNA polymerase sigma-70 factor (ECF subfamily)
VNEEQLIRAAQRSDLDAFNRLVLAHEGLAFNVALRLLSDPAAAADATQDAFISAYRSIRRYRGGSFKAWLLRIVTNTCYDELRRQRRRPIADLDGENEESGRMDPPGWLADPGESPEELAERADLGAAIQRCLEQLDPEFRTVLVLVDVQGFDYAEAAEAVNKPLGTLKSRLARGRRRMQDCLQGVAELLPAAMRLSDEAASCNK